MFLGVAKVTPLFGATVHVHTHGQMHGERGTPVLFALKVTGVDSE